MLAERATSIAHTYWASHFGCSSEELFSQPFRLLAHGGELAGYGGAVALFRGDAVMASIPPDCTYTLRGMLSGMSHHVTPDDFISALRSVATVILGPAYVGYATEISQPVHPVRALDSGDRTAIHALQMSCDPIHWEHGGSSLDHPCSGVFIGDQLVAVAGYEVWGGTIAHISIITHPDFRRQGYGRNAVAHLADRAIHAGLLPQYRTLQSNLPSVRIAESLGFYPYATSVAVRLNLVTRN